MVSIIMPMRNAAPWIEETIQSICEQSISDWELIVIDDHSLDSSVDLVQKFNDPRIQILENKNHGIIPALQLGLRKAKGAYITRMDADDLMPKDKLEVLRELLLNANHRTIATGKVEYFAEKEVSGGYLNYQNWLNARCEKDDHFDHIFRECVIASPNWMVRRDTLLEDGFFNLLQYPEDYDMTFHWLKKNYSIVSSEKTTHLWREHPTRTSRNSEIYAQKSFFDLKLRWFKMLHSGIDQLAIFGADQKGKIAVQNLKDHFQIHWYDISHERFTSPVNGYSIEDPRSCKEKFALVAVYPENLTKLELFLSEKGFVIGKNTWYL